MVRFPAVAMLLCLTGCGGGGSSSAPTTPAAAAPVFTSPATATVAENAVAAYQATATDANGDAITFSIAGGTDAARFAITPSGALSFTTAPNFEQPADANADNVYAVQLRASDGGLVSTLDLTVTVTNSREGIRVRRIATGFDQPVYVTAYPGTSDVFVLEKTGNIYRLNPASGTRTLLRTMQNISTAGEGGLLGLAPYPGFAEANLSTDFAIAYVTAADGSIELRRCQFPPNNPPPNCAVIMTIPHPGQTNHYGGWVSFGPDGRLWVGVGDGGGAGDPNNNAQNPFSRLGKILRLDPNPAGGPAGPFTPPLGNPYAAGGGDPYVFALGVRNPFRGSFDIQGRLYFGDVGENTLEEINVARTDQPGLNFGWRFFEGTNPFTGTPPAGFVHTQPVTQYGRSLGGSVIGGYVYRGPINSLRGSYVFGDYVSGTIWSVPADALTQGSLLPTSRYEQRNLDFTPDVGTITRLVSFGEDESGNLYLVDIGGSVYIVEPG